MNLRQISCALLFSMLLGFPCRESGAQGKPRLFSDIEAAFRTEEPTWKIEQILEQPVADPSDESITFRQGKLKASIHLMVWRRLQDARDVFAGQVVFMDNTFGKHADKRSLPSLGDENYMWKNRASDAWPTIIFRKDNVYVIVFAPSVVIAQRFAKRIEKKIDPSQ